MNLTPEGLEELKRLEAKATMAPWCVESCGSKGDGSNMIGVAFGPDDPDCKKPLSGMLPEFTDDGDEIEYYRDELVAECEHRNRNAGYDAMFIAALRNAAPELIASARRVVELEAEREAMQLEIDQGREAREMMNDSIDALQSRLFAAEEIVELFRAQNPNSPDGACECGTCDALRVYDRTAGATDADGGGKK